MGRFWKLKHSQRYFTMGQKRWHFGALKYQPPLKQSYQSDLAYFRNDCLDRSWCVWGSAEMPCALRVLGPISWALGSTDWHLCNFLFSSWISSSLSASLLSRSRILSSFSSRILAKSSSRSLMLKSALNFAAILRDMDRMINSQPDAHSLQEHGHRSPPSKCAQTDDAPIIPLHCPLVYFTRKEQNGV